MPYQISQRVDNYLKYRPSYPRAVLDLLKERCQLTPGQLIADVGCGTGMLAKLFLQNGNRVIGVEPDPDMRAGAEFFLKEFVHFNSVGATAEATSLADDSVDFITVGQAFHWFDLEQARREFARILLPQGWVMLVWNAQKAEGTPFLEALQEFWQTEQFVKSATAEAKRQRERIQALRLNPRLVEQQLLDPFFGPGAYRQEVFQNPLKCDLEGLKGRVLSNAPALEPDDPMYTGMIDALEEIFRTHQVDGTVTIEHDTRVVYGRL